MKGRPVRREFTLTQSKIDEAALLTDRRMSRGMGAAAYFFGVVRGSEEGRGISAIEYEAFDKMVRRQFDLIFDRVEKQWPVESVRLVHRVGRVAVGEGSVWVEVVAPHREEAFAACQFILSEMKRAVPIWKRIKNDKVENCP